MEGSKAPETGSSPEASTREIMIEAMNKLGEKRQELGVLSIGKNPDDPDQRADFFIAPIDAESGKSINDGGSVDIVFATTEGFFAIRHSGTQDGRNSFRKLRDDLLRMWGHNDPAPRTHDGKYTTIGDSFKFSKDSKRGYSLEFEAPLLYGGKKNYTEVGKGLGINFIEKIVPVGQETVDRAFEASKEGVRELKMDPQRGVRLQQSQEAARSLLDKMKEI